MATRLSTAQPRGTTAVRHSAVVRTGIAVGVTSSDSALRHVDWVSQQKMIMPMPPSNDAGMDPSSSASKITREVMS